VVFCATAATIVSGAMAERTKFSGYLIYSAVLSAIIYPVFGSWAWGWGSLFKGEGWLEGLGFIDFAGSTVVHSVDAISVHGVCGAWGTLAAGIFNIGGTSAKILGVQLLGIGIPVMFYADNTCQKTQKLKIRAENVK